MDHDILEAINEATKEADSFESHPAKALGLEERLLYLQGLALVMNADGNIYQEEIEYLRILIKSLDMDDGSLDSFVSFAKKPDKDTIQAFFRAFRRKPIAQLFLFDALTMTRRSRLAGDKKISVVNKFADQLELLKVTQQDVFDLFCFIRNRNWKESALYFDSHLLASDYFKHLLAHYELDFGELMADTVWIRRKRLMIVTLNRLLDEFMGKLSKYYEDANCVPEITRITSDTAILTLLSNLFVSSLQAGIDLAALQIKKGIIYNTIEDNKEYASLTGLGVSFNKKSRIISVEHDNHIEIIERFLSGLLGNSLDLDKAESINIKYIERVLYDLLYSWKVPK